MRSIGEFFARMKGRQSQEIALRMAVQQALKKAAGLDCEVADISFKSFSVRVKGLSQTAKAQLFMKKAAILREIAAQALGREVRDISFS